MAELKAIHFQSHIPVAEDEARNRKLMNGVVLVETTQDQSVLSSLPQADVDRLSGALSSLLDILNADSKTTKKILCWHLALTDSTDGKGGDEHGGSGKSTNKDTGRKGGGS